MAAIRIFYLSKKPACNIQLVPSGTTHVYFCHEYISFLRITMTRQIATIIEQILDPEHEWKYQLLRQWHAIFGPLSDKVHLEKIHNDTLILVVWNSCWLHELYALSDVLLASINEKLDKPRIKKLRFKRGEQYAESQREHIKAYTPPKPCRTINAREQNALKSISDPALAKVLQGFLKRCIVNEGEERNERTSINRKHNPNQRHDILVFGRKKTNR